MSTSKPKNTSSCSFLTVTTTVLLPVLVSLLVYQLDTFDPAPLPLHELTQPPLDAPLKYSSILKGAELIGVGALQGPEDIVYDKELDMIYTGCADGWIKRVTLNESGDDMVIENWVNTGGRPLGLTIGLYHELIVADAYMGLLNISKQGEMETLSEEANGTKFKFADGVAMANDGTIYFTDASNKYDFSNFIFDILEGKPHGRLLKYDPATNKTSVLADQLYFPNGVVVSPFQDYLVFCETLMRRCRKYYLEGNKKGEIEKFIDNLPGLPDNIHHRNNHYWIALATEITVYWDILQRYPVARKIAAMVTKAVGMVEGEKYGGVFVVDLEGKAIAQYRDRELSLISSGVRIENDLYFGSVMYPYIIRLNLDKNPAV